MEGKHEVRNYCDELLGIANASISDVEEIVSTEPLTNFILFMEIVRVYDSWTCSSEKLQWDGECSKQEYDVLGLGFNLAIYYFLKPIERSGFPLNESTEITRKFATSILYKLGCAVMIKRSVAMVEAGLLILEKKDNCFVFKNTKEMEYQFLDQMEFSQSNDLNTKINENSENQLNGWDFFELEDISKTFFQEGNFYSKNSKNNFSSFLLNDITTIMRPLINPWGTGKGVFMGYGSSIDIEMHFLAVATELVGHWRVEAGFHLDAQIEGLSGADLCFIISLLVSFYLKHGHFAYIASKELPEINLPMSLPIWTPVEKMIEDTSALPSVDEQLVRKAFSILIFKPSEAIFLNAHTTKFVPLLIDIGNGFVLRPYSAIAYNPFFSLISLLEFRNPNTRHKLSLPRENWMREELYASFAGVRYQTIKGNIKLRVGKKIITDIDAVVFDNLTGELAIFQLKWQDFYFNDVKKLRSRASNLIHELEGWAIKTTAWISANGNSELARNLRLKIEKSRPMSSIFLFAISRTKARMKGYGFSIKADNLAVCNWPQFSRNRFEVGPAEKVISTLFNNIKCQENEALKIKPFPVTFQFGESNLEYLDLYSHVENVKDSDRHLEDSKDKI
ncbi:hypothetical protein DHW03_13945 [Pedobacter yonginense]|uniref:Uncharacterized protein n=1 Tax=Pedobacter yonginense TaxID=651869 RepID=A0A317EKB5_9SPHI|nr:hypothetical protein [Pedobacter yonginense]PWS27102.1 hypothetical protein DHW03_13945 [Pedobacter yonginense]